MMLLMSQTNDAHRPIPRGIVIHFSFITPLKPFHLVFA